MTLLGPKHGPHIILQIVSSLIIINVPRDAPFQISQFLVCPIVPLTLFLEMAKIWPFYGQNMVLTLSQKLVPPEF